NSKKYALVVIAIVLLLSLLSMWCVIPKDTMNSALTVKFSNANVECIAQGDYNPKPLFNTEIAPSTPNQDENEIDILCLGAQGDYKPKPLDGSGD
ncbi:MAG: hypothetical protein H8D22_02560, partial [Candidatus Cloacimonetes bacterium]|nr:hypothetical protein [Candidatus Cloacimonadota bacterium]